MLQLFTVSLAIKSAYFDLIFPQNLLLLFTTGFMALLRTNFDCFAQQKQTSSIAVAGYY